MSPRPRTLIAGAGACVLAFLVLLGLAYGSDRARWVDAASLQGFLGLQGPTTSPVAHHVAALGNALQVGLIGGGLALVALARGRPRVAAFVIALLAVTSVSSQVLKALLGYPRHDPAIGTTFIVPESFPSGHATASMALAIALVVVVPARLRPAAAVAGAALAIGVSFSIVASGWHFPSDVVGGYLLATGWALVLLAGLRAAQGRYPERHVRGRLAEGVTRATERAAALGLATAVAALAAAAAVVALAVIAFRLPELMNYARDHTAFVAVAGAVSLSAMGLLAVLTGAMTRRS
jgi:membrane-associated phospholipid phosphatase